ncbi:cytotoxic and regulatory T-cell molecule [Dendropsophus ebraccatus]|uniref:cytotoxic and regulatory T-cell molecule n=1 Tax=Dendropsophus ebraccatus TaxID=150705 RepID=UPI003831A111
MIVAAAVYVLLTLSNVKAESHTSSLSVEEGKAVTLRCVFPGGNGSGIQWLTPKGYTSYFNGEKVLKDRRYELVQSSRNKLIIRLSNVTEADEGVYSCLYYSSPVQSKRIRLTVLAAPAPPSLDVTRIPGKRLKEKYLLTCSTSGGRPCPRLSWLIDNHTEVHGHHNRRLESDGRCTAVSDLRISAVTRASSVTCVVRHRTLTPGNLTAAYSFHTEYAVTSTPSAEKYTQGVTSGRKGEDETTEISMPAQNTTDVNTTSATNEVSSTGNETTAENHTTDGADRNVTADIVTFTPSLEDSSLVTGVTTTSDNTTDYDVLSSGRESQRTLILVLVSLMLCVLLVIVHLFLLKLRKAHYSWKKENETSDQTLESTKSRSNNEETSSQSKNVATTTTNATTPVNASHKIQYNTQVSM